MKKIAIILPAYNEEKVIGDTIKEIRKEIKKSFSYDIVVVDDGSSDKTRIRAEKHADVVLHHIKNRGLGAALATGIEYARRNGYRAVVTFDSDGQHNPSDIEKAVKKLEEGYDVVIGSRFKNKRNNIPFVRRQILRVSNLITYALFGIWTSDSQSGFRALGKNAVEKIRLTSNRMEVSSEFFGQIKTHGLKMAEIPVWVKYTDYSLKKGQSNTDSLGVLIKLLYKVTH